MDVTTAAVQAITALIGGVGGFAASIKSIRNNIVSLERKVKKLTEDTVQNTEISLWKQSVIQGLRLEWEELKSEIKSDIEKRISLFERSSYDRESSPIGIEDLKRRLEKMERDIDKILTQRFVAQTDFNDFAREQVRQWNEMNRSLGEIMGEQKRNR